jgi:hypothetical protein
LKLNDPTEDCLKWARSIFMDYEGDIAEMEATVEEMYNELDHLYEAVTEMAESIDRMAEDLEDCLCNDCEDLQAEEYIEFIPCQCGEEPNNEEEIE